MKNLVVLAIASVLSLSGLCQEYIVTKVQGTVYYNGKVLTKGSHIKNPDKVVAVSKTAGFRLLLPGKGTYPVSFESGKRVVARTGSKTSELYELVVQDYIDKYTFFRSSMKTKGAADPDWFNFFYDFSNATARKILIIQDQKIALKSKVFKTDKIFHLYICTYHGRDSIENELPIVNDSIVFTSSAYPIHHNFKWKLKMSDGKNNSKKIVITDNPIEGNFITHTEFEGIMELFKADWQNNYATTDDAKNELLDYLRFNYGKLYFPAVETYIKRAFGPGAE